MIEALREAEKIKGTPPYTIEVYLILCASNPQLRTYSTLLALQDLFRDDQVLADDALDRWSLNPQM